MIVLASDYDGTLKIKGKIAESDLEAIRAFQAAGNKFGIITGRTIGMIKYELAKYGVPYDFMVCGNGGTLVDGQCNIIKRFDIDPDAAMELIETVKTDKNISLSVSDGDRYGSIQRSKGKEKKMDQAPEPSPAQVDGLQLVEEGVFGTFVLSHSVEGQSLVLKEQLEKQFEGRMAFHNNNGIIDISAPFVDKKTGIEVLSEYLNNPVYVIGDGYNDLPMIKAFHGFAVSHANEEVKKEASMIFDSVKECLEYLSEKEK